MMFGMFPPCSVPGLIPFGAFRGAEEKVSPSEVAGRQDPLASAPFLAERRRTLVSGAHGEDQQPPADDDTEAAQHRLSGDVDDVRDAGARGVQRRLAQAAYHLHHPSRGLRRLRRFGGLLRAGKRRERSSDDQRHHDRERERSSHELHRVTSWSLVRRPIGRNPAYLKRPPAGKFAQGYNWPLLLSRGPEPSSLPASASTTKNPPSSRASPCGSPMSLRPSP